MGGTSSKEVSGKDAASETIAPPANQPLRTIKAPTENDPLPNEPLPKKLQKMVDDEDTLLEQIYDGR